MTWLFASAQPELVKAAEPALSTLAQSVIGALLLLSWGLTIFMLVQLIKVQNARISDKEKDSDRNEKLNQKLIEVFSGVKNSLDNLTAAEKEGQEVIKGVKQSLDTVIFQAVQQVQHIRSLRPKSGSGGG